MITPNLRFVFNVVVESHLPCSPLFPGRGDGVFWEGLLQRQPVVATFPTQTVRAGRPQFCRGATTDANVCCAKPLLPNRKLKEYRIYGKIHVDFFAGEPSWLKP